MFARFNTENAIQRILPSGGLFASAQLIPPDFFTTFMTTPSLALQNAPTVPGAGDQLVPKVRIMHTPGTDTYRDNLMLLQANVNNLKEGVSPPRTLDVTTAYGSDALNSLFIYTGTQG